jgi:lambda repressor-like predicted transcriptional regulator
MAGLDKLTAVFIKIRAARAELSAKFKAEDADLEAQQDLVRAALLAHMKEAGVESVRTKAGLIYRTLKTRYWTSDWESMHRFILENEVPDFLEKRLNQSAVKSFLEEHPDTVPPGLNVDSEYSITVRKT